MKSILKLSPVILLIFLLQTNTAFAQKKGGHHGYYKHQGNPNKVVIVNKYPYHARHHYYNHAYHPVWGPPMGYHRRWIYFPHYNFYWDNFSGMYVYWGGGMWVRTASPPPMIINVNLSSQRRYELNEPDDAIDDIYGKNDDHKKTYPDD